MANLDALAQDWPALSRHLDEALTLAPAEQRVWLDALPEDAGIKEQLRVLLGLAGSGAPSAETCDFVDALPRLTLDPDQQDFAGSAADRVDQAGTLVGPYRLLRQLGAGGMGLVWLAERVDGGLKRQVALKLPRLGGSGGLAERMARERDILVSLDHPNIARILDAGVDAQGRPYLALEPVQGEELDAYCRARALPVRARLALLLQVARAVAHAHARLVVHRDLKPANILVTADGQVRLLDFGIAKLLEGELTRATHLTQQAGRALTLDYASPEQIRGEALGTASDVYSLGVVAYELLTEGKPYQLKRQSAAALEEAIASVDVRLASTAAGSASVRRALKGDLDAILNKALKKAVAERYATADALAQDIERHLADQPVRARPDAWGDRLQKFTRRHAWPLSAAAAVLLSLLAGLSLAIWQAGEARTQALRAERVKDFVLSIFDDADSTSTAGTKRSGAELLQRARQRVGEDIARNPELAVELMTAIGSSMLGQGLMDEAATLMQQASALALQRLGAEHALSCAAQVVRGQALVELGRNREAITQLAPAIASARQAGDLRTLMAGLRWQSTAYFNEARMAEGLAAAREAVEVLSARPRRGPPPTTRDVMLAHHAYSEALGQVDSPGAAAQARLALAAAQQIYGQQVAQPVLDIRTALAMALVTEGPLEEGLHELDTLIPATEALLGPTHAGVSKVAHLVGDARLSAGDVEGAIAAFERSMAVEDASSGPQNDFNRGMARYFLASAYDTAAQFGPALARMAEADRLLSASSGPDNIRTLRVRSRHAFILAEAGRLQEADAGFKALDGVRWPADSLAGHQRRLALLRSRQGRHAEALQLATSANAELLKSSNRNLRARGLRELGLVQLEAGNAQAALPLLQQAAALFAQTQLAQSPERLRVQQALDRAHRELAGKAPSRG